MSTITIGKDGVEFIHTNVIVPRHLRDLARERGISLSKELRQALEEKLNRGSGK
jgi:post-segregation antitoxin (ccd killing protein)